MSGVRLAQATSARAGRPNALRVGTVVSVDETGATVSVGGGEVLAGVPASASAGVGPGAIVSVFKQGDSWQVQGALGGGGNGVTNAVLLAAQVSNQGATLASGITTGSGEVFSNVLISTGPDRVLPLGHLIEIRFGVNFSINAANGQVGARIRVGSGVSGTQVGSGHGFGPTSGFTYELYASGWIIGTGLPASYGLTVQNFTAASSLTVTSSAIAPGLCGIIDWGDGTGVSFI